MEQKCERSLYREKYSKAGKLKSLFSTYDEFREMRRRLIEKLKTTES
ncbi:hypothetical protein LEP1GSC036_4165 [Leptospira weilii str. 2006001853]|uniref:Uncharacterized protein n=1 Tax=Leptospira weilii str. 2006001853 TaxID=1001589 RepID=A0A828Z0J2_9LEPT|nr:hypothetical protein LEP1GSC036_4165 [Leptospira weilii str. 2006001853]EMJ65133.1 hypothetical protein LEP1GSC051_4160 [Leptospira sp. P2653]